MNDPLVVIVLFVVVAGLGLRGSWRLTRRYREVRLELVERERWILLSLVIVSWVVTGAAFYYGGVTVRTLLGAEPLPALRPVSILIATAILLIPAFLDYVVEHVARVPWK